VCLANLGSHLWRLNTSASATYNRQHRPKRATQGPGVPKAAWRQMTTKEPWLKLEWQPKRYFLENICCKNVKSSCYYHSRCYSNSVPRTINLSSFPMYWVSCGAAKGLFTQNTNCVSRDAKFGHPTQIERLRFGSYGKKFGCTA
jgi:hypothetical protein